MSPDDPSGATLRDAVAASSLVVMVGNGGVGKTSLSAAVAFGRARRGESVAVLTVDPAPRLGDALGIAAIDADPKQVALPPDATGSLAAMRLDTKRTFDRLVQRQASTPESAEALLAHPIYRAISEQLGGTDSYMAFQRLHELVEQAAGDVLVIDTPPAANATQLLSAPSRLTGLVETGALSILAEPARIAARAGGRIARATIALLLAAVERVTGARVQGDVAAFVELFSELLGGLEDRSRQIDALLRAPTTAFVLVTRALRSDVAEALALRSQLADGGIQVAAVVVNRVLPAATDGGSAVLEGVPEHLHAAIRRMEADIAWLRAAQREAIVELLAGMDAAGAPGQVFFVEERGADVTTLDDIAELAGGLGF